MGVAMFTSGLVAVLLIVAAVFGLAAAFRLLWRVLLGYALFWLSAAALTVAAVFFMR